MMATVPLPGLVLGPMFQDHEQIPLLLAVVAPSPWAVLSLPDGVE